MDYGILSLMPVLLVLILAFTIKDVFISLLSGIIFCGLIIDIKTKTLFVGFDSIYKVFQSDYSVKSLLFCLMIGGFVYVIEASGGVHGIVVYLTKKKQLVKSPKGAQFLALLIGVFVFIDATSSTVISGVTARPLFDHFDVSRERLAYITDSTSAPIAWLVPFNGAGAFLIALIGAQVSAGTINVDPMATIIAAVPYQLYGIFSILLVMVIIMFGKDPSSKISISANSEMNNTEAVANEYQGYEGDKEPKASNSIVPILLLVGIVMGIIISTGDGSTGIYIGVILTLILTGLFYVIRGVASLKTYIEWVVKGMSNYMGITMILALAFALSNLISELGTGAYIASMSGSFNPVFVPVMIFILGAVMSFGTGTSGGTVGILFPIAIPMAAALQLDLPLVIGAIISGGLFGDHCSPISDSTILSSMIAEIDVMDHVSTQMPYSIIAASVSCVGFLILGFIG